jgi:hypothetical protein
MTKQLSSIAIVLFVSLVCSIHVQGQTISGFENLSVPTDSFINGSSNTLGYTFSSGNADFENYYDTAWGGYWSGGWAMSSVIDSTNTGPGNLYGAITGTGESSSTYAIGTNEARIALTGNASGKLAQGIYITNSTYAAISMRDGDGFAKQFGGMDGNDPDFFRLDIIGTLNGTVTDTVKFYLADYRFMDNSMDYIVKSWEWVDLSPLGNVDTLHFQLVSSDATAFGNNTPNFFAIDNFTTFDSGLTLSETAFSTINLFPNPAQNQVNIEGIESGKFEVFSITGSKVLEGNLENGSLDISSLKPAFYLIHVLHRNALYTAKLQVK